jgi:hypothetical protein
VKFATAQFRCLSIAAAAADQGVVPADVVDRYLFGEVLDGRNAHLATGVQRVLGREARDFREYARDTAATGIWKVPAVIS